MIFTLVFGGIVVVEGVRVLFRNGVTFFRSTSMLLGITVNGRGRNLWEEKFVLGILNVFWELDLGFIMGVFYFVKCYRGSTVGVLCDLVRVIWVILMCGEFDWVIWLS